jgi:hypothetical protein
LAFSLLYLEITSTTALREGANKKSMTWQITLADSYLNPKEDAECAEKRREKERNRRKVKTIIKFVSRG